MDDAAQNLQVVTDHLLDLAGRQARAADQIGGSSRGVGGITHRVENTHGMACVLTSRALAAAELVGAHARVERVRARIALLELQDRVASALRMRRARWGGWVRALRALGAHADSGYRAEEVAAATAAGGDDL